jgi:hypothetical protein
MEVVMTMNRVVKKTMVTAMVVGASVACFGVAPVIADGDQLCETGEVCLSDGTNLLGNKFTTPSDQFGLDGFKYAGTNTFVLNKASSIQNRGSATFRVLVYDGNWTGPVNCYPPAAISYSLPNAVRGNLANNSDSSIDWISGASC